MSEWTTQRLEEIIQVNPTVKLTKGEVYPFIDIDKVSPSLRSVTNEEEKVYDGQSCSKFCNGDTVFSRITPCLENRKIAKVSIDGQAAFGSTEFYVFRAKEGKSDEDFVYYLTSSDAVVLPAINSMTGASGRQRADKRFIERTKLNVPDLQTQKRIAEILSAYDDLIENNNRRIALLEKAAQELYKEWFVRFRFPGYENAKFENGLPEGWERLRFRDIAEIGRGSSPRPISDQRYFENGSIPWIKIADATSSKIYIHSTKEYVNNYGASFSRKLPIGSLILAASGTLGFPMFLAVEGCIHDGWLYFSNFEKNFSKYIYYVLMDLREVFNNVSYGAAIQNINTEIVRKSNIIAPDDDILSKFTCYIEEIHNEIISLQKKNQNLAKQRDLLLPRLMSGKLDV